MTPFRAKRNSRAPERFSSDDIKTDSANGALNSNSGDKSNSKVSTKSKTTYHEPIKVKLPKLKRAQPMQSASVGKDFAGTNYGTILSKIKLPLKKPIQRAKEFAKTSSSSLINTSTKTQSGSQLVGKPFTHKRSDLSLLASSSNQLEIENPPKPGAQQPKNELPSDYPETNSQLDKRSRLCSDSELEKKMESSGASGIRCACGVDDDLGIMIECEKCSNWQHGHCINVGQVEDAYEGYICAYCLLPAGKHRDSLHQLVIDDKFTSKFEALETSMIVRNDEEAAAKPSTMSPTNFTFDELQLATSDLKRVAHSLEAKWKILTSDDYNAELRIWRNPIWSDDPEENRIQQQETLRFVGDIYKGNLKLNIVSMLNRMHKRCQLIRYQISSIDISEEGVQSQYDKLLATLDQIANLVERVTDDLKTI